MNTSRNYETLREEILKKSVIIKEVLTSSGNTDNVNIDDIEVPRKSVENLQIEFENFLNSDSTKFRRVFIPLNLINKDVYWKNLQALFNKVYDSSP